jgi:NAD(P)-dependent dehydrogenase (short-subunit alcohol dehydrogenase family)
MASRERQLEGRVAVVTGASSGIGAALCREVVLRGGNVVLVARRAERLSALVEELGAGAVAVQGDVTRDGDVRRAVATAVEQFGGVDILFANAGFAVAGAVRDLSLDDYRRQFETNVFGVLRSVKEAMPELEARRGCIGIVGSVNGYVSIPGWSAYCMSKHAVRSLAESLRLELLPRGVSVTHLAPGFVESDIRRTDGHSRLHEGASDPIPAFIIAKAPSAARTMVSAVMERRAEAVITAHGKVAVGVQRHAPAVIGAVLRLGGGVAERLSKRPSGG